MNEQQANSHQTVELPFEFLQLITHRNKRVEHFTTFVHTFAILVDHLSGSRQLESSHFDQGINRAQEFDILLGVLPDFRGRLRLGSELRKLRLPIPQRAFVHPYYRGNLFD